MQENDNVELITFDLGGQLYGIEVKKVREILTYQEPTKLPNTKPWIGGVINIRGEVTPIVDLRIRFKISQNPSCLPSTPIIAAKTFDGRMMGIVVDDIYDFAAINMSDLIETPSIGLSIPKEYVKGFARFGDDAIAALDIDKILSLDELERGFE